MQPLWQIFSVLFESQIYAQAKLKFSLNTHTLNKQAGLAMSKSSFVEVPIAILFSFFDLDNLTRCRFLHCTDPIYETYYRVMLPWDLPSSKH